MSKVMKKLTLKEHKELEKEIESVKKSIKFSMSQTPKEHPEYKELEKLWLRTIRAEKVLKSR